MDNHAPRTELPISAVFMVEPGHYEWPAVLLVASLRAFAYDDLRLHAYCRAHLIDQLHPRTLAFFEANGVVLEPIAPEFEVIYPQGNKLYACAAKRADSATILFDTDMFQLRPALLSQTVVPGCISGRPTANWMWGDSVAQWKTAYDSVDVEMPRYRMARPDGSFVAPSISAGYVAYEDPDFGKAWLEVGLAIEKRRLAEGIYPTLDQISLPVAAARAGLRLNMIDVKWNKAGKIDKGALRNIVAYHYQKAETLLELPIKWLADRLLSEFSDFETLEVLLEFYENEAQRPSDVLHNAGFRDTVLKPQRAVSKKHRS